MAAPKDLVARLLKLDSCAVSDAMDSLSLPPAITGIRRLATDKKIAGPVLTVKLGAARPEGAPVRHLCTAAIEAAEPGSIIVVEQRTGLDAGGWGGVLSNAAKFRGVAGAIVDGPSRDIDEAQGLGFPVFARGTTARTARGRVYEVGFNQPVDIGDAHVAPGDLVIADGTAVVFIPQARAEEVVAAAERIAKKEQLMVEAVQRGEPASQVMGANYETMLGKG
jgi:4-hydroxy-4-methyl-2-oxoglutarate aldolase